MINYINYTLLSNEALLIIGQKTLSIIQSTNTIHDSLIPYIEKLEVAQKEYLPKFEIEEKRLRKERIRAKYEVPSKPQIPTTPSHYHKSEWSEAVKKITTVFQRHNWDNFKHGSATESKAILDMLAELNERCSAELSILNSIKDMDDKTLLNHYQNQTKHEEQTSTTTIEDTSFKSGRSNLEKAINDLYIIISAIQTSASTQDLTYLEIAINKAIVEAQNSIEATKCEK